METPDDRNDKAEPWDEVNDRFTELARRIGNTYRDSASAGPSEEEIRSALHTLGSAWESMTSAVASALGDPEVRRDVSEAAGSMASAIGDSLGAFGRAVEKERERNEGKWHPHDESAATEEE
ncbi:MAG: hypothetical protein GEU79_06925 [Acidimicrobiia bacterium]|nr:hypothetical protein [Acidimicrobiia bacterium]